MTSSATTPPGPPTPGTRLSLSDRQRFDWIRLIRCESVGPRTFRTLLNRFGSARAALEALPDLAREAGRTVRMAPEAQIEGELAAMAALGARFVACGEPDYPRALDAVDAAPPLLAVRGRLEALATPGVAIVGARNASALGLRFAGTLARGLGDAGLLVVSGLARGIDAAAHEASCATGTAAVMAGGLGRIYPKEHAGLADRIAERGCILSEMPFGWTATGRDFPRRNRIVSGMSYGVVVVEAALRSGSLITARFATEQGREVFAVPGSPLDPRAEGTNRLIREGATLATGVEDILEGLRPLLATGEPPPPPLRDSGGSADEPLWDEWEEIAGPAPRGLPDGPAAAEEEAPASPDDRLLAVLGPSPVSIDDLVRSSGLAARQVQQIVMELDLAGRIERHGDSRVSMV